MSGSGTPDDPWQCTTPPGGSAFTMHRDEDKQVLHCQVGSTWLHYHIDAADHLLAMLREHGDWMELGNKDEKVEPKPGTVEAWGRSPDNPVGGWYGLRKGYRGRFGNYVPPVLEALGLAEVEHNARNNRMRAI